jgi:hypothetical protein
VLCTWSWDRSATWAAAAARREAALPARRLAAVPDVDLRAAVVDLRAAVVRPELALRAELLFEALEPRADVDRPDEPEDAAERDVDRFAAEPLPDVLRLAVLLRPPDPPDDDDLGCGMGLLPGC